MKFTANKLHRWLAITILLLSVAPDSNAEETKASLTPEPGEELSGGETTIFDATRSAFGFEAHNLKAEHRPSFLVGHSFFNENWVVAPASTVGRDGLGPLFNARSCSACHFKDGRDHPPDAMQALTTMLLRISVPGTGPHNEPRPDPTYGGQFQTGAILGVPAEGDVYVTYEEVVGSFADGQKYSLRKPAYSIKNLGYGPMAKDAMYSPRLAPAMIGLGLLEAIPSETLISLAARQKLDGHGIAGRVNMVWDCIAQKKAPGRFGWKAEQPAVLQQTATAFVEDIGITSSIMPVENYTKYQEDRARQPVMRHPEITDKILQEVVAYSCTLAVPARRNWADPAVLHGKALFAQADCTACHMPKLQTGECSKFPELSNQTIRPYTDLLLHDMGEGLSDNRPVFAASGRDWRTPPLWGIGLVQKVNGHTCFLHDGRARNLTEAILWHEGEARAARESFRNFSRSDRDALLAFLQSL
jgi:CxxC motif-containing protein (DUF1111 family)